MNIWRYFLRAFSVKGIKYGMILLFIALFLSIVALLPKEEEVVSGTLKNETKILNNNLSEIVFTGVTSSIVKLIDLSEKTYEFNLQEGETKKFSTENISRVEVFGEVRYEYKIFGYPYSILGVPAFFLFIVGMVLVLRSTSVYIRDVTEEIKEKSRKKPK
ncbi:MAG TPA: hypothetical protein ENG20_00205 [Methanomicrobia archaeon]|nr:hypothetical protein [Methanomicrobia archaeon]